MFYFWVISIVFLGVYSENITFAYYIHKVALVAVLCCRAFNSKFKWKWLHHHNRLYTVCINVMLANEGWDTPLLIFSLRCTSKTKSILEVQNIFKTFWLWMWEVDRVIFCPVVSSIHFSYGIGLPLLINSRFDWKSSYEKCFSLAIESSIFVVNVKYKKSNGRTRINPTGGLSHAPFIEAEVLFASSPCFFTAALRQISKAK